MFTKRHRLFLCIDSEKINTDRGKALSEVSISEKVILGSISYDFSGLSPDAKWTKKSRPSKN